MMKLPLTTKVRMQRLRAAERQIAGERNGVLEELKQLDKRIDAMMEGKG